MHCIMRAQVGLLRSFEQRNRRLKAWRRSIHAYERAAHSREMFVPLSMPRAILGRILLLSVVALMVLGLASAAHAYRVPALQSEGLRLAYLDPGSGSFVVQALIAMFAGIIVTTRMYWSKIKSFLGLSSSLPGEGDDEDEDDV